MGRRQQVEAEAAAIAAGALKVLDARGPSEFEATFSVMRKDRTDALLILVDPMFFGQREGLAGLTTRSRLPAVSGLRQFADAGILMTYGASLPDLFRRAGTYVDIFKHVGRVNRESIVVDEIVV